MRLAVGVDIDASPRSAVRGVVVDALPAVGVVGRVTFQLGCPTSLSVLCHAGGREVSLVELVWIECGVRGSRCQEQSTNHECSDRKASCKPFLKTHDEPFLLRMSEDFLQTSQIIRC